MSASRLSDGPLAIKKPPSSCRRRFDKPMATQIAHHSSRISVGSIITVARKQGLRTTIGLRRRLGPGPSRPTRICRAPGFAAAVDPTIAHGDKVQRVLYELVRPARYVTWEYFSRQRLGRPFHRSLRGRRGRRRLDGHLASADRGRAHAEVFANARGHGPDARAPGGRRSPPVPRRFLRCGRGDGGPRTPRRSEEALPGGEPDPPPEGTVPLDDPESRGPSLPNPSPLPGIRGTEAGLHVDPGESPSGSPP